MVAQQPDGDWVSAFADETIAEADRRSITGPIVCASGLSPSGPIHLGNLREVMTPHLVADEIRRRGCDCVHIVSWDDYDRLRKVPAGIDPSWATHIGKPLTSVPAPDGSQYTNWAEHFKAPMINALAELGIDFRGISQTEMYTSGAYRAQIRQAMASRDRIDSVLERYRTKGSRRSAEGEQPQSGNLDTAERSGAASEDDGKGSAGYFPYKPYCSVCDRDLTTVTAYDDGTTDLSYVCVCGHRETVALDKHDRGKLVWKVDWPMRWAYEGVIFEPSGVDHSSPGSSFVVGSQLVKEIFTSEPPIGPMYAFVGITGMAKMSSSRGEVPTPTDALEIIEVPILRWLYARRKPNQSFKVAFDQEIHRLYDEWDALEHKIADGTATASEIATHARATGTATITLPVTPRPLPFRMLASVVDITTGDDNQVLRVLRDIDPNSPLISLSETRPRLDLATHWAQTQMPEEQRTHVRDEPDRELIASLGQNELASLRLLLEGLDSHWSLDGLTKLVYGVPKVLAGLDPDVTPTPELKLAQRRFFALLYGLLVGRDTGPRLPTLLLAVGAGRVRALLTAPE